MIAKEGQYEPFLDEVQGDRQRLDEDDPAAAVGTGGQGRAVGEPLRGGLRCEWPPFHSPSYAFVPIEILALSKAFLHQAPVDDFEVQAPERSGRAVERDGLKCLGALVRTYNNFAPCLVEE